MRVYSGTLKGLSMEKWLCWGSLGVAGVLLLLFLMDLILGFPFGFADADKFIVNILGILACAAVGYLAWESFKELR
jgi:hypothetical protein